MTLKEIKEVWKNYISWYQINEDKNQFLGSMCFLLQYLENILLRYTSIWNYLNSDKAVWMI